MKYDSQEMINHVSDFQKNRCNYDAFDNEEFQTLLSKIHGKIIYTTSADRLCILYQLAKQNKDYPAAELGVFQGGSAYVLASVIKEPIYLYDTFEGLPEVSEFDQFSEGALAANIEDTKLFLKEFDNLQFFKGIFPESASEVEEGLGLVHLDCDLYEGTKAGLEYFYPRMIQGGTILIDDYGYKTTLGVKKAVDEFMKNKDDLFLTFATGQAMIVVGSIGNKAGNQLA